MEANNEFVLYAKRRSPQVAARPHHMLQDGAFIIGSRIKREDFFSFCNRDLICGIEEFPCGFFVKAFFPGICDFFDLNMLGIKNLLRSLTRESIFSKISPIDRHHSVLRK